MNCREIELLLPEYAAGRLSQEKADEAAAHLKSCTSCGEALSEITKLFETITHEKAVIVPPPNFFETVWDNLYRRIQREGLNKPVDTVSVWLANFFNSFRRSAFQIVNAVLIIAAGTWFFISYRADRIKPSQSVISNLIEQANPQLRNQMGAEIDKGREILKDVISMGLTSGGPIEKLKDFLDPENQGQLYNSVTDRIADIVISVSKKS